MIRPPSSTKLGSSSSSTSFPSSPSLLLAAMNNYPTTCNLRSLLSSPTLATVSTTVSTLLILLPLLNPPTHTPALGFLLLSYLHGLTILLPSLKKRPSMYHDAAIYPKYIVQKTLATTTIAASALAYLHTELHACVYTRELPRPLKALALLFPLLIIAGVLQCITVPTPQLDLRHLNGSGLSIPGLDRSVRENGVVMKGTSGIGRWSTVDPGGLEKPANFRTVLGAPGVASLTATILLLPLNTLLLLTNASVTTSSTTTDLRAEYGIVMCYLYHSLLKNYVCWSHTVTQQQRELKGTQSPLVFLDVPVLTHFRALILGYRKFFSLAHNGKFSIVTIVISAFTGYLGSLLTVNSFANTVKWEHLLWLVAWIVACGAGMGGALILGKKRLGVEGVAAVDVMFNIGVMGICFWIRRRVASDSHHENAHEHDQLESESEGSGDDLYDVMSGFVPLLLAVFKVNDSFSKRLRSYCSRQQIGLALRQDGVMASGEGHYGEFLFQYFKVVAKMEEERGALKLVKGGFQSTQKAEKSGKVVPLGGRGDNSDTASTNVSHSGSSKHVVNNSPRGQSQTGDGDCKEGVGRQRGRQSSLFLAAVYGIAERGGEKKNALREDERELSFAGSIGGMLRGDSEKAALNELVKNCGVQMYIQASVEDENLVSGIMTFAVSQTMGEVLHYASEHGFGKNLQEVEVFNKRHRYIKATSKDDRKEFVLDQVMQPITEDCVFVGVRSRPKISCSLERRSKRISARGTGTRSVQAARSRGASKKIQQVREVGDVHLEGFCVRAFGENGCKEDAQESSCLFGGWPDRDKTATFSEGCHVTYISCRNDQATSLGRRSEVVRKTMEEALTGINSYFVGLNVARTELDMQGEVSFNTLRKFSVGASGIDLAKLQDKTEESGARHTLTAEELQKDRRLSILRSADEEGRDSGAALPPQASSLTPSSARPTRIPFFVMKVEETSASPDESAESGQECGHESRPSKLSFLDKMTGAGEGLAGTMVGTIKGVTIRSKSVKNKSVRSSGSATSKGSATPKGSARSTSPRRLTSRKSETTSVELYKNVKNLHFPSFGFMDEDVNRFYYRVAAFIGGGFLLVSALLLGLVSFRLMGWRSRCKVELGNECAWDHASPKLPFVGGMYTAQRASCALANFTEIDMGGCEVDDVAKIDASSLHRLKKLSMSGMGLTAGDVFALAKGELPMLMSLDFSDNNLDEIPQGWEGLVGVGRGLEVDLRGNEVARILKLGGVFGSTCVRSKIDVLPSWFWGDTLKVDAGGLDVLDLSDNEFGTGVFKELAERGVGVAFLDLSNNALQGLAGLGGNSSSACTVCGEAGGVEEGSRMNVGSVDVGRHFEGEELDCSGTSWLNVFESDIEIDCL